MDEDPALRSWLGGLAAEGQPEGGDAAATLLGRLPRDLGGSAAPLSARDAPQAVPAAHDRLDDDAGDTTDAADEPTTWVELLLEDDEGEPMPRVRCCLEDAKGRLTTATSNANGIVHVRGVAPGEVQVTLLDYDASAWALGA